MSAQPGHPALRRRITDALATYLENHAPSATAMRVGRDRSTILRRTADLQDWPADELLLLALSDRDLREALRGYLFGDELAPQGQPVAVIGDLIAQIGKDALVSGAISAALRDGHVSPSEASDVVIALHERRRHEDETVMPSLLAVAKGDA